MEFEIIDCHVHPFLNKDTKTGRINGPATSDEFVAEMKRAGISRCCGSVIKKLANPTFEQIMALNREALEFRKLYPNFFVPGIHVLPSCPEESCREIEELYHKENVRWIGEIVGYFMDYPSYLGDGMFKIYELAQDLDLPVNIHPADFAEMKTICENFPDLKLVIAHPTDGASMLERFEFIKKHKNAYLDLSGTGLFRWSMLREGLNIAGREKILFGTDFPICNPAMYVQAVLFEHLNDVEFEAVFSGNFKRLTGLLC